MLPHWSSGPLKSSGVRELSVARCPSPTTSTPTSPGSTRICAPIRCSQTSALVEGHLDGAAFALIGDGQEGIAPLLEPEGVSQHGAQINSTADNEVKVV